MTVAEYIYLFQTSPAADIPIDEVCLFQKMPFSPESCYSRAAHLRAQIPPKLLVLYERTNFTACIFASIFFLSTLNPLYLALFPCLPTASIIILFSNCNVICHSYQVANHLVPLFKVILTGP